MLRELSGREHRVVSAVTFRTPEQEKSVTDETVVFVAPLDDDEINYYIDKYRPFDKAGGYGIQEWLGYAAIGRIEGSYYNVMGFPVHRVWELLQDFA
jgi:septum formation protein